MGLADDLVEIAGKKSTGFGTNKADERDNLETAQTMFLTDADITAIADVLFTAANGAGTAAEFANVAAKDLQTAAKQVGFRPVSVDVALFGRMTTTEALRDVQAAAQVAHALSTHKVDHEFDYFTAVDDRQGSSGEEEDAGADMIGDVEYNSACYYKYISIDFGGLVDNLTGVRSAGRKDVPADEQAAAVKLAGDAVLALIKAATLTTPTGKQNSFAAHQLPDTILVEIRPKNTPVSYANAFVKPARSGHDSLTEDSRNKLKQHVQAITAGFDLTSNARLLLCPEDTAFTIEGTERVASLNALGSRIAEVITHG